MATSDRRYDAWLADLSVEEIGRAFASRGCREVLVRRLSGRQGNSKQQIYCGTDYTQVTKIPSGELVSMPSTSSKPGAAGRAVFRAGVDLWWIAPGFKDVPAPNSKLIYYPQYPEVRLSGFLQSSPDAPTSLLSIDKRGKEDGRVLLVAPTLGGRVYGLVLPPDARARDAVLELGSEQYGPFRIWQLTVAAKAEDPRVALLSRLHRVSAMGWQPPMMLRSDGTLRPCKGTNCGGYTLEALVGVSANGRAEPDYAGWELKAHKATRLDSASEAGVLTLMTPEPDGGSYVRGPIVDWVFTNGYTNLAERWDFGGILKAGGPGHHKTGARLELDGYAPGGKWAGDGAVVVVGRGDEVIASWSYTKLLDHWRRKHAQTAYVPYVTRIDRSELRYGTLVHLGEGTSFTRLLDAFATGAVYYDPGINLKLQPDGTWKSKKRSQFRAKSVDLRSLYDNWTLVDAANYEPA